MKETAVFTNMCMVYDEKGNVLVQNRVDPEWGGITFPGGHVEKGESFTDSVIREIREETGLTIRPPRICGVKQFFLEDGTRYVVLCYKTCHFTGQLTSSLEGQMSWVRLEDMENMKLARGMEYMIRLFLDDSVSEHIILEKNGEKRNVLQ